MFQMNRADTEHQMAPTQRAAEALRAAIAAIVKPNRLTLTERMLTRARKSMAAAAEAERAAIHGFNRKRPASNVTSDDIAALTKELEEATGVVNRFRGDLAKERQAFGPVFVKAHGQQVADVQSQMLALVDELGFAAEALRTAKRFAGENGLPIMNLVDSADHIRNVLNDLRRALGAQR